MTNVLAFVASLALAASGIACKNNAGGNGAGSGEGTGGGGGTTVSVTGVSINSKPGVIKVNWYGTITSNRSTK